MKLVEKPLAGFALEIFGAVKAKVGVEEPGLFQVGYVGGQQFGVVSYHRAVVVVVADTLVKVIGHTGVEDGVHALLHQRLHMAVEQLGGVTHGVRGDCALALEIELAAGLGGEDHPEIESCEQLEPEGEVLIHIQAEGNTDSPSGAISLPRPMEGAEVVVFVAHQVGQMAGLLPQRTGAPGCRRRSAAPRQRS